MTEVAPEAVVEQQPETEKPATGEKDWAAEADKWKALARKHEIDAKAGKAAAAKLAEIEDAQKTAEQKAADAASATERRALEAEARATRLEVAFEKGLSPAQAKRLVGGTREELEADADEVLRDFPVQPSTPPPAPSFGGGPRQTVVPTDPRSADLAQIEADLNLRRRK